MRQNSERHIVEAGALAPISDALHRTVLRSEPPRSRLALASGIQIYGSFEEAEPVWREFEGTAQGTAFQRFDWLSNWHKYVGEAEGIEPAIVTVTRGGHVIMLAALGIEWHMGLRRLIWLGGRMADYKAPLLAADFATYVSPDGFPTLWRQICRALPPHDFVQLEDQPEFVAGALNPFATLDSQPSADKAYVFSLPDTFEELTMRYRPETRRIDRAKARKLSALGKVAFRTIRPGVEAALKLDEILDHKAAQLRAQGVHSIFEDEAYRAAFRSLALLSGDYAIVEVAELTLDGKFLSGSVSLQMQGHSTLIVHTYVQGLHDRLSPGRLHLLEHLNASIEAGYRTYDLSVGHAPYKTSFCDAPMSMFSHISARNAVAYPLVGAVQARVALKRSIKANPKLMGVYRRLREKFAGA
ncbi:MAG: GNAT family N-acetyltransferase [Rhizobiales bacterium]|nr:GNAT family N-acetyltransferase [Hyphomicrobiales bacterium]